MGRVIDSRQFSREGKEGTLFTFKARAPSPGTAKGIILPQVLPRFPSKANNISVVGVRQTGKLLGPVNTYEVDVFVPVKDAQAPQVESGDTRKGEQMT